MHSHHSHSGQFCSHAHPDTTLEQMLTRASSLGFHTYCLSEHVPRQYDSELYPEEIAEGSTPSSLLSKFKSYLVEARKLQEKEQHRDGGLNVLVGAETENVSPTTLQWLKREVFRSEAKDTPPALVGKGVVDYLVGSVHHAGAILPCCGSVAEVKAAPTGIPIDFDAGTFESARDHFCRRRGASSETTTESLLRLCLSYFEAQYRLIDELRPEVIGHFDLIRLFAPNLQIYGDAGALQGQEDATTAMRREVQEASDRSIRLAASYGALFEVNSASVRKGWPSPYPGKDVIERIIQLGGRLCLSDDAHGPTHVATNYRESRDYLLSQGVTSIWYLTLDKDDVSEKILIDEEARQQRQAPTIPGKNAPTRFPRGTRAIEVQRWWEDAFWDGLEERK